MDCGRIETVIRKAKRMEKITRFKDIPQFTRNGSYQVDMDIKRIPGWIETEQK